MIERRPLTQEEKAISEWLVNGFSQKGKVKAHLAEICDVTRQAVNDWCVKGKVDKRHLGKISQYLGSPIPSKAYGSEDDDKPSVNDRLYQSKIYQDAEKEHKDIVDSVANEMLQMSKEEAKRLKQAMELLRGKNTSEG